MRLKDKTAVITGAGSGIGRATAILFAQEGAKVICVDINSQSAQETVALIDAQNHEASAINADVANIDDIKKVAEKCQESMEKLDILFNNAGRNIDQKFEDTTEETWAQMLGINLTGVFLCSKHLLPLLKMSPAGSIINHASIDAILGNPRFAAYSAAKGGVIPLTHVMAHDLAKYGIRVNCISTGGIRTGMTSSLQSIYHTRIAVTPLQRMGEPEEVAYATLFLASDEASYVNAANIVIDGGRTAITQGCF